MNNNINMVVGVVRVETRSVNENTNAINFTGAETIGYGENKKTVFHQFVLYAKVGAQTEYYEKVIVKGAQLPISGTLTTGNAYTDKNGSSITPWVINVKSIGVGINNVQLAGRLTTDAKVSEKDGKIVARYTIAVDRPYKDAPTDFISCVQFGQEGLKKVVEQYFKKGQALAVSGRVQTGSYTNKEGATIYTTEMLVRDFSFFGKKSESDSDTTPTPTPTTTSTPTPTPTQNDGFIPISDDEEEDLPF
jgi:single-strand DNA-binding protein